MEHCRLLEHLGKVNQAQGWKTAFCLNFAVGMIFFVILLVGAFVKEEVSREENTFF